MSDYLYTIGDTTALSPSNENFCLHTHSAYEIFFFLEGAPINYNLADYYFSRNFLQKVSRALQKTL